LVCDDEPSLCEIFHELLASEGFRVTVRAAPCDNLHEVVALAPDLIILDLLFGGRRQGTNFMEQLKTNPATLGIPLLVCTASEGLTGPPHIDWTCAAVAKPFELNDLLGAVRRCLHTNQGAD
jgi:CheY-like chemotaxis protein